MLYCLFEKFMILIRKKINKKNIVLKNDILILFKFFPKNMFRLNLIDD